MSEIELIYTVIFPKLHLFAAGTGVDLSFPDPLAVFVSHRNCKGAVSFFYGFVRKPAGPVFIGVSMDFDVRVFVLVAERHRDRTGIYVVVWNISAPPGIGKCA